MGSIEEGRLPAGMLIRDFRAGFVVEARQVVVSRGGELANARMRRRL